MKKNLFEFKIVLDTTGRLHFTTDWNFDKLDKSEKVKISDNMMKVLALLQKAKMVQHVRTGITENALLSDQPEMGILMMEKLDQHLESLMIAEMSQFQEYKSDLDDKPVFRSIDAFNNNH